jgi:hypothetical protein
MKNTGKPRLWTFVDICKHGNFTTELVINCIKDTGLRGRLGFDARIWNNDEAKQIIELCTSTLDGTRYA